MNHRALFYAIVLAAVALVPASARANDDAVHFGYDINVPADRTIKDAVCFFCNVHIQGEATGDVVVFFGGARIDGRTQQDVVNFFGRTRLGDNASVGGDLVNFFGGVRAGENVQIGKGLVIMFASLHAPASISIGQDRVIIPGWILWIPLIIFALIVTVIVNEFRKWQRRRMLAAYQYPPQA